jgi:NRPS condensation-like uncharacterized protein
LVRVTSAAAEYRRIRHSGIDATRQPQVSVCLWRESTRDTLLVRMTHEVGDGAALQYLVARLGSIYSELCADPDHRPAANTGVDRDLTQVLSQLPAGEYRRILWDFVRFMAPRHSPRRTHRLPLPREPIGAAALVATTISPARAAGLSAFAKARHATLNDMMLAAAYRALAAVGSWDGTSGLRIPMTVNLRRWAPVKEQPGPISNQSAFEWPFLIRDLGADFEETLTKVRDITRSRKTSRPGFALAILTHLWWKIQKPPATLAQRHAGHTAMPESEPDLTFSNEGALDKAGIAFGSQAPAAARVVPPFFAAPRLHVSLSGYRGCLELLAVTSENCRPFVERFFEALRAELPQVR